MTTTAERRAAHRLAQNTTPPLLRTWHAVQILDGAHYGSGRRGFLVGVCDHTPARLQVLIAGGGPLVCCLPLSDLTGFVTLHGGKQCTGEDCAEGNPIDLKEAL